MNNIHKAIIRYTSTALALSSVIASVCMYWVASNTDDNTVEVSESPSLIMIKEDYGATDDWTDEDDAGSSFVINLSHDELYEAMFEDVAQPSMYEHLDYGTEYTTVEVTVRPIPTEDTTILTTEDTTEDTTVAPVTSETTQVTVTSEVTSESTTKEKTTTAKTTVETTKAPRESDTTTAIVTTSYVQPIETSIIDVAPVITTRKTTASVTTRITTATTTKKTTTATTTATTTTHETKAPVTNTDGPGTYVDDDAIYKKMLELLNKARADVGLDPLWYSARVHEVAALRAYECSYYYTHERPNGTRFSTAFKDAGIKYKTCGENIAYGRNIFSTVEEVFQAWMDSPSHYENIVNPKYECVAFGLNKVVSKGSTWYYWTQEFCTFDE